MNNKGSVLILVLWSLFILAMLAVAVYAYVLPHAELSGRLMERTKMHYFANAGVERAIFEVKMMIRNSTIVFTIRGARMTRLLIM